MFLTAASGAGGALREGNARWAAQYGGALYVGTVEEG